MKCVLIIGIMILISLCSAESNLEQMDKLQALLNSYHFTIKPQIDVFDCVDISAANYRFLKEKGYNTQIVIVEDGLAPDGTKAGHCMAMVEIGDGWICIETKQAVINTNESIGKIIGIDPAFIRAIYRSPEDVYAVDARGPPTDRDNVIVTNMV
jgi:hypothetical protein